MRVLGTLTISDPLADETMILISLSEQPRIFKFRVNIYAVNERKISRFWLSR